MEQEVNLPSEWTVKVGRKKKTPNEAAKAFHICTQFYVGKKKNETFYTVGNTVAELSDIAGSLILGFLYILKKTKKVGSSRRG